MLDTVRKINSFFKKANRADIDNILSQIILSERQGRVFDMFYIKRQNIGFIADTLCVSESVIKRELNSIRSKMLALF